MGEGKEYVSRSDELGNIHISEEVLAVIAAAAALEVEGVGGLAANLGTDLAELLGKKTLSRRERYRGCQYPGQIRAHHSRGGPGCAGGRDEQHRGDQRSDGRGCERQCGRGHF